MLPKVKIKDKKIKIKTEKHSVLVTVRDDKIYLDGEPLKEHHLSFEEKSEKSKTKKWEKEEVKTIREHMGKNVLRIDKSKKDGRLFFLYFTNGTFDNWRGKARWKASYWVKSKWEKRFYLNNLKIHSPYKTWEKKDLVRKFKDMRVSDYG